MGKWSEQETWKHCKEHCPHKLRKRNGSSVTEYKSSRSGYLELHPMSIWCVCTELRGLVEET
jgi:hypothetical protein